MSSLSILSKQGKECHIQDKTWLNYYKDEPDKMTMKAVTYHHLADEAKGKTRDTKGKFIKKKEK